MGRHSARDDDLEAPSEDVAVLDEASPPSSARHAHAADEAVGPAADEPADADVPDAAAETAPLPRPPAARVSSTHADLHLLRENPALRARCAAGVVVPFVLYIAVLVVIGKLDVFLLWVWIPAVTAGVVVGTFLDVAHRHARS